MNKSIKYHIAFKALNTKSEVVGTGKFIITTNHKLDTEHKALSFQRLCVEYARLIGISCSFAEIVDIMIFEK